MIDMRNLKLTIIAFLAVMLMISVASAGTFDLTNSNVNQLAGIDIRVTTDGAAKTISVELVNNPLSNTPLGIDEFYYQLDGVTSVYKITSEDDPSGVWHTNFDGGTADGFGPFISLKNNNPGGTGGLTGSPITFTLANSFLDSNILTNGHNAKFAAHIRYDGGCSGFVSDGTTTPGDNSNCKPTTQIPEFPTIVLPAAAAIGLVFFFQHRKNKKE
ncbi:MAG: hypothetical protein OIN66_11815 [Candidatus Methanoperedens sp.]|nr:hypothetical protein [Candidatus Methanoperedens sp.]